VTTQLWPFAVGFVACTIVVPYLIAWQRARKIGQRVYEDGPRSHAAKEGTPTMGGIAFIAAAALGLIFARSPFDLRLLVYPTFSVHACSGPRRREPDEAITAAATATVRHVAAATGPPPRRVF